MREPEFLPSWYPALQRRRVYLITQAAVTAALIVGLLCFWFCLHRGVDRQKASLAAVNKDLANANAQLQILAEKERLTSELEEQDEVVRRLGTHVPGARLLDVLSDVMPKEMALRELTVSTDELTRTPPVGQSSKENQSVDHVVKLRVLGVTPTDVELSTFIGGVEAIPYFSDVQLVNSKDSVDGGHLMREFEVTFSMDLDPMNGAEAAAQ